MHFDPNAVTQVQLPLWGDLSAIALGAIYGATRGTARRVPLVGVLLMGVLMGFGGSMIRDLLLNAPINALVQPWNLPTAVGAALIGAVVGHRWPQPRGIFDLLDALVLGTFTVIGTEKALAYGMPIGSAIFIGTMSAVGGGIIIDVLLDERPDIMSRGPWLASAVVLGSAWFCFVSALGQTRTAEWSTVALVVTMRVLSIRLGWQAPMPGDLAPSKWTSVLRNSVQETAAEAENLLQPRKEPPNES